MLLPWLVVTHPTTSHDVSPHPVFATTMNKQHVLVCAYAHVCQFLCVRLVKLSKLHKRHNYLEQSMCVSLVTYISWTSTRCMCRNHACTFNIVLGNTCSCYENIMCNTRDVFINISQILELCFASVFAIVFISYLNLIAKLL